MDVPRNLSRPVDFDYLAIGRFAACLTVALAALACSDTPTAPEDTLKFCHISGASGAVIDIRQSEFATHKSHGDYPVNFLVDKQSSSVGDSIHYRKIGDAVAAARSIRTSRNETAAGACRITISVAPGIFQGSIPEPSDPSFERFPIVLDFPDVTLAGSFKMELDAGGRATGKGLDAAATTLAASPGLVRRSTGGIAQNLRNEPIIVVNSHTGGGRANGVTIQGFVFKSGNEDAPATTGGNAVFAIRAQRLLIKGNSVETAFSDPFDLRSSSGRVEQNYLRGRGGACAICFSGPGNYEAIGNRHLGPGGIPGILILPTDSLPIPLGLAVEPLPPAALVTASVVNNEFRNHQAVPVGVGLRINGIGPGAPGVAGTARVIAEDNNFANNRFAIIVDAAFPVANTTLKGDIDLTLRRNVLIGSCQNALLVSFSRHTTALGLATLPFAKNSTFNLVLGGDITRDEIWYAHPAGQSNTFMVDGLAMANGSRAEYDAGRMCGAP